MDTKAFMIVTCTLDPNHMSEFKQYVGSAQPIFAKYGGKRLGQYAVRDTKFGDSGFSHVVVMEFPDRAAIDSVFADPNYIDLIPARTLAFPKLDILIADAFAPPQG